MFTFVGQIVALMYVSMTALVAFLPVIDNEPGK